MSSGSEGEMDKDIEDALQRIKQALSKDRTDRVINFSVRPKEIEPISSRQSANILPFEPKTEG